MLLAKPEILFAGPRYDCRALPLQVEIMLSVERAGNDLVSGEKDYVGSRRFTHLAADPIVNGVAGDDESERSAGGFRAEEQWLERHLVETMIAEQVTLAGVRLQQAFQLQLQIVSAVELVATTGPP